ncbi:MAG: hypothetical protein AAFN07_13835 [Pseudomonadota bacterium]
MANGTRWYQKSEMIAAMSALVVSVVAVVVAVYSAWIDRSFARASTWPYIEMFRSYNASSLSFGVANRGTGPAIIRYAVLEHDGRAYSTWAQWLAAEFAVPETGFVQSHISTRVLSPEQHIDVLVLNDSDVAREIAQSDGTVMTVCYCSVFDECWLTGQQNQPKPVDHCDAPPLIVFEQ